MAKYERLAAAERAGGRAFRSLEREERRDAVFFASFIVLILASVAFLVIWPVTQGSSSVQTLALIGGGFLLFVIVVLLAVMILGRRAYKAVLGAGRELSGRRRRR